MFNDLEEIIKDLEQGKIVCISDNENIENEIREYIVFYNEERPAYSLNYLTPKQYREYYAQF